MSTSEIKSEINKVLDHLQDKTLEDILLLLKKIEQREKSFPVNQDLLQKIIGEDAELFHKLAQ